MSNMKQFELYDNISEFIHNFEENKKKKNKVNLKVLENFLDDDYNGQTEPLNIIYTLEKVHRELDAEIIKEEKHYAMMHLLPQ